MESKTNLQGNATKPQPRKKVPMFLIAAVITLSVIAILLGLKLYLDNRTHKENLAFIEAEKNELEGELQELIYEYDTLKNQNDSLYDQLQAEQDKIRALMKRQASSAQKIRMYERELQTLRKVMRSYIVQIDSLNTRNRELTEENIQVKQQLQQVSSDVETLTREKENLSETVKVAQRLDAKDIVAEGLNKNSKSKDKINKIVRVRVCCTIRENSVAKPGPKTIYLQIIRPDDVILSAEEPGMFEHDGEQLVYSAKRVLEYDNADIPFCIYWEATEELIEGTYLITLYSEGYEIGTSTMVLK